MSRVNRRRLTPHPVTYLQADLFTWEPPQSYDVVFFSFWLSHIPPDRFADFWNVVERALRPGGRIFFIDSYQEERSEAADQRENLLSQRELSDGRQFEIIKVSTSRWNSSSVCTRLAGTSRSIEPHCTFCMAQGIGDRGSR